MYFVIKCGQIEETDKETWLQSYASIGVFTNEEWKNEADYKSEYQLNQSHENIHFCKLETHVDYLFGTMRMPEKGDYTNSRRFAFYILEGKIIFIDDNEYVLNGIKNIMSSKRRKEYSLERFFYDFLVTIIDGDLLYMEKIERKIAQLEEDILDGRFEGFNFTMLEIRKEVAKLYRYYSELADVGEELADNEIDFFGKDDVATFNVFTDRASRLQSEAQVLRDYSMQVQDVYRAEINIRQNNVMKVLTVVTTIFLPLTLIAGWYGMNFKYMPELNWEYGYFTVILLSVLVVIGSIYIFKRKKLW